MPAVDVPERPALRRVDRDQRPDGAAEDRHGRGAERAPDLQRRLRVDLAAHPMQRPRVLERDVRRHRLLGTRGVGGHAGRQDLLEQGRERAVHRLDHHPRLDAPSRHQPRVHVGVVGRERLDVAERRLRGEHEQPAVRRVAGRARHHEAPAVLPFGDVREVGVAVRRAPLEDVGDVLVVQEMELLGHEPDATRSSLGPPPPTTSCGCARRCSPSR